jgi:hypothetical protein
MASSEVEMTSEADLKEILQEGTLLVKRVASAEIDIQDFIKEYDNFYYYNALDGHEADTALSLLFQKYSEVIKLHREVQTDVVDLLYVGDEKNISRYLDAGRLSLEQAKARLRNIVESYDVQGLLSDLAKSVK